MPEGDANQLRQHAEDALARSFDPSRVLPILHRLAKHAQAGSDDEIFAHLRLSELLVDRSPWRASIHARRVLAHRPDEDRAWAVLALAQTLLGHYRFAQRAYERALAARPDNPWYAHNLGHLLDVALSNPKDAVPWLERAHSRAPTHADVAASFAHALARAGHVERARAILAPFRTKSPKKELAALLRWLDAGALESQTTRAKAAPGAPVTLGTSRRLSRLELAREAREANVPRDSTKPAARTRRPGAARAAGLLEVLGQGLRHLPLDARQRTRARSLARDAVARFGAGGLGAVMGVADGRSGRDAAQPVPALAAAIAYAIVYVDHVPLSAAEVASPFRVSASRLRASFEALRTELDLIRGDTRYATQHRV